MKKIIILIVILVVIVIGFFTFKIFEKKEAHATPTNTNDLSSTQSNVPPNSTTNNKDAINSKNITNANNDINKTSNVTTGDKSTTPDTNTSANNQTGLKNSPEKTTPINNNTNSTNNTKPNVSTNNTSVYATAAQRNSIIGSYQLANFSKGANSKLSQEVSSINITSNNLVLVNNYNGNNPYESSNKMCVYQFNTTQFTTTFGTTPQKVGLSGSTFNVYSIGNVFIYQLPNKNILFSYENFAGNAINTSNALPASNISSWYGTYTIKNKVGQLNGFNSYGQNSINISGNTLIMTASEYKYDGVTIQNPKYYLYQVPPKAILGTSYTGAALTNGTLYCIAVLGPKQPLSNFVYNNLASYTGCVGQHVWLANVAMPIILGPNNTVQVFNNNYQIYSTEKTS